LELPVGGSVERPGRGAVVGSQRKGEAGEVAGGVMVSDGRSHPRMDAQRDRVCGRRVPVGESGDGGTEATVGPAVEGFGQLMEHEQVGAELGEVLEGEADGALQVAFEDSGDQLDVLTVFALEGPGRGDGLLGDDPGLVEVTGVCVGGGLRDLDHRGCVEPGQLLVGTVASGQQELERISVEVGVRAYVRRGRRRLGCVMHAARVRDGADRPLTLR
jgi:hypothetical protein